jgi:hypothetical protein
MDSNQSIASYDYIRDPRRCVLQIDREKGLGFVLSATGDYDHTITSVDKVCIHFKIKFQIEFILVCCIVFCCGYRWLTSP